MYGFKILCEISKVPFEISHKNLNQYSVKYALYQVLKIWYLKVLSLSETDPGRLLPSIWLQSEWCDTFPSMF